MRSSVVATLVFLGLIGLGVRAQKLPAQDESGPRKARPAAAKPEAVFVVQGWGSTSALARQDALRRAQERLREELQARYPGLQFTPTAEYIDQKLVRAVLGDERVGDLLRDGKADRDALPASSDDPRVSVDEMRRYTLQVEFTKEFVAEATRLDREQRVTGRMADLGRVLAVLVLLLGAFSAYIRADEWTRGYYTGWLRTLAVGAVAAGAAAIWFLT
jgi:hypothetical protein